VRPDWRVGGGVGLLSTGEVCAVSVDVAGVVVVGVGEWKWAK